MAAEKWMSIVVDGTAAMGPYWHSILYDYLQKIVRHFCEPKEKVADPPVVGLGLVMYKAHGPPDYDCLVQCSGWTKDGDLFIRYLESLSFSGGCSNEAAIAEGLADALVMFPKPLEGEASEEYFATERHCILVAANNPYTLKKPLLASKISDGRLFGAQTQQILADAPTVAQMYPEFAISLSVISPRQLPTLREIFKMGNNIGKEEEFPRTEYEKGHTIVLISEKFKEAHAALSQPKAETPRNSSTSQSQSSGDVPTQSSSSETPNNSISQSQGSEDVPTQSSFSETLNNNTSHPRVPGMCQPNHLPQIKLDISEEENSSEESSSA